MSPEFDRRAFRDLSYGLYIVTSLDGERLNGQIVNTVIQVTSEPARVAVIINKQNFTHELIAKSGLFGVSVLDESAPLAFLGPFGFRSGREVDKLSQVQYKIGVTGCPVVLDHALSILETKVIDQIDLGTHSIFIGDTVNAEVLKEGAAPYIPLLPGVSQRKGTGNCPDLQFGQMTGYHIIAGEGGASFRADDCNG